MGNVSAKNEELLVSNASPNIIEHVILQGETLQGLCLKYKVSSTQIRRYNYFSGNAIQHLAVLRIPLEPGLTFKQVETNDVILQKFRNITQENTAESTIYLDSSQWNLENAIEAWKKDETFSVFKNMNDSIFSHTYITEELIDEHKVVKASQILTLTNHINDNSNNNNFLKVVKPVEVMFEYESNSHEKVYDVTYDDLQPLLGNF
jgi:hypothetical protein